jgi:hypothetical protein
MGEFTFVRTVFALLPQIYSTQLAYSFSVPIRWSFRELCYFTTVLNFDLGVKASLIVDDCQVKVYATMID